MEKQLAVPQHSRITMAEYFKAVSRDLEGSQQRNDKCLMWLTCQLTQFDHYTFYTCIEMSPHTTQIIQLLCQKF